MEQRVIFCILVLLVGAACVQASEFQDGREARGMPRHLLQTNSTTKPSNPKEISVGYSASATFKVPKGGDALKAFNQSRDYLAKVGGGILRIEAGTYIFSGQWILTSNNTQVIGAGINATTLKLQDKAKKFRYAGFIRCRWVKNITYSNFTVDGNKAKQLTTTKSAMLQSSITYGRYGFYADGFTGLTFRFVRIKNCQGYGFDPHGIKFDPTIFSKGIDIQYCESINNGWDGYTIDEIIGGVVANNYAEGNGRHAYNIVTGTKNVVVRNNVANNTGFGSGQEKSGNGCAYVVNDNFELGTSNITVSNNKAIKSNKAGFCILGAVNVNILNNDLGNAKYCGHITQARTKKILVQGNKCASKGGLYISGASKSQITVKGNFGF